MQKTITLTAADIQEWTTAFQNTGKLPSNEIPCCKCHKGVTATHGNLLLKIAKYETLEKLLTSFICRTCNAEILSRDPKTPKLSKPLNKTSKVKKSKHKKPISILDEIKDTHGRYNIPLVNLNNESKQSYTMDQIAKNPALTREFTENVCMRPRLYLDNDSTCDECNLFEHCGCGVKRLSKTKLKALAQL